MSVSSSSARAHFIVLNANALDGIRQARRIADAYLDGARLDLPGPLEKVGKVANIPLAVSGRN